MPVRAALFSYFELDDLTRLLDAISGSGMPAETRVRERTLTADEERKVSPRFSERVPDESTLLGLSTARRTAWGTDENNRTFVMVDASRAVARGMAAL